MSSKICLPYIKFFNDPRLIAGEKGYQFFWIDASSLDQ